MFVGVILSSSLRGELNCFIPIAVITSENKYVAFIRSKLKKVNFHFLAIVYYSDLISFHWNHFKFLKNNRPFLNCKITVLIFSWLVLLGSCVPTMFMLLVFVILSWQEKCVCLNLEDEEDDPHIRPPPRCGTHASAVITNTRWLRVIIFVTSASFICATSLISIVS